MSNEQQLQWLKDDIDRIEGKVDSLLEFKWQILGGTAILSVIVGVIAQIAIAWAAR